MAALLGLSLLAGGCNFAKTGAVALGAPDVVTALPAVSGIATSLTVAAGTVSALATLGISITPTGTAQAQGSVVSFPITSGYVEVHSDHSVQPGWVRGSLDHSGSGLDFASLTTTLHLTDFVVDPGNSMLYATVNGKVGVPLLFLDGSKVTERVDAAGQVVLDGTVAKLTQTAATALNATFATTAVTAGTPLGTVEIVASGEPVTYNLPDLPAHPGHPHQRLVLDKVTTLSRLGGTSTTLTLDPGVASALTAAGLALSPTGTATSPAAGAVTFPITGGFVAIHADRGFSPGYVLGSILHQGSGVTVHTVATSAGAPAVSLSDFVVDPGDSALTGTVDGKIGVPLFFLDGSRLRVTPTPGGATLDGTVAQLTSVASGALDAAFKTSLFTPGMVIGTVHLVATGG